MAATRRAEATWSGALATGDGSVSAVSSGVFTDLPVTWAARTEEPGGKTSPEELVAAAHASCFCMAFSGALGRAGSPPTRLDVSAEVTFAQVDGGWRVASSALTVRGVVPGISARTSTPRPRRPATAARSPGAEGQCRAERRGDAGRVARGACEDLLARADRQQPARVRDRHRLDLRVA